MMEDGLTIVTPEGCLTMGLESGIQFLYAMCDAYGFEDGQQIDSVHEITFALAEYVKMNMQCDCDDPSCQDNKEAVEFSDKLLGMIGKKLLIVERLIHPDEEDFFTRCGDRKSVV